jgi:hypothetical protein
LEEKPMLKEKKNQKEKTGMIKKIKEVGKEL